MFEPTRVVGLSLEEADSSSSSDVEDSGLPTAINRLVNTSWCLCSQCTPQATTEECRRCKEDPNAAQLAEGLTCLVDHHEFDIVCLNPAVLRVALAGIAATRGDPIRLPLSNK